MPKKFVFVLMPFSDDFTDIYKLGIKKTCEDTDLYCERVDEQIYDGSMLDRIYNQIVHADVIVADMTGQNPNVFYEVGFAHALKKKVILITQSGEDIPFDMKHFIHIIYDRNKISDLCESLKPRLDWYSHEGNTDIDLELNISININGIDLSYSEVNAISIPLYTDNTFIDINIDAGGAIHASALSHSHIDQQVYFSLLLSQELPVSLGAKFRNSELKQLPDYTNRFDFANEKTITLIPGRWWLDDVYLSIETDKEEDFLRIIDKSYEAKFVIHRSNALPIEYKLALLFNLEHDN